MADEARKLVKKATKLLTPSLMAMRMKADWDQATPMFEEAARIFARTAQHHDAQYCFERASEGQKRLGSELHAVRHLESAAECAVKDKRHEDAFNLYRTSYEMFAGIGKIALGAKTLAKGATLLSDEGKIDLVEQLYEIAIEAVEDEGGVDSSSAGSLVITSQEIFGNYTKILVENKRFEEAARNELRYAAFINSLSSFNGSRSLCRAYLQAIVLNLVAGNGQEALATWNDCFEVEGFMSSKSASYAQDLLDMCRAGDYNAFLESVLNSGVLYDLDNTIARLLKKMKEETFNKTANGVGIERNDISQFQAQEGEDDLC
jgi:tetratricopeptide (TPR) repeat protein